MMTLEELARNIGGRLSGDGSTVITGISSIKEAKKGEVAVLTNPAFKKDLERCEASALILGEDAGEVSPQGRNVVLVKNPSQAYLHVARLFVTPRGVQKGIHPLATVSDEASIGEDVSVSPYACIEKGAVLEKNVTVYPFVYIGEKVRIGEGSILYPHVTVYDGTQIGKGVTIHSGTVIGGDGFGYMWDGTHHAKIPQLGIVEIGDDVEIGANVTIDRASLGRTVIGRGVRIDNQVMIAHNVTIGENSIIVAQVGIAGSSTIGKHVILAGQVGVKDHVTIGDFVKAGGGTGITSNVKENSLVMGYPHMPHREWARLQGYLKRLPKLFEKMRRLEKKLQLEDENGRDH